MTMRCVIFLCLFGAQTTVHIMASSIDEIITSSAEKANEFALFQSTEEGILSVNVELDMRYTAEQWIKIQQLNRNKRGLKERHKRKAIRLDEYRWNDGVIPYKIADNVFTEEQRAEIQRALDEWQTFTCITFKMASTSDVNYVFFDNGGGCFSYVGMVGGSQQVGLARGCRVKGVIVHEVGHAMGFQHEQTRPDRDDYVEIIQENIPPNLRYNFQKYEKEVVNIFDVPYDYESVMHYGPKAFSVTGEETIRTKDPKYQSVIGNRMGLSFLDIKMANLMYNCSRKGDCEDIECPDEGFLDKNCRCMCRGDPVRECPGTTPGPESGTRTKTVTQPGTGGCTDLYSSCPQWAERGECENHPTHMKAYCQKSCNMCDSDCGDIECPDEGFLDKNCRCMCRDNPVRECPGTTPGPGSETRTVTQPGTGGCTDLYSSCPEWAARGECENHPIHMKAYCQKSCNLCALLL